MWSGPRGCYAQKLDASNQLNRRELITNLAQEQNKGTTQNPWTSDELDEHQVVRTVRTYQADCPPGADRAARARKM
jgi:hypothetical protein